RGFRWSFIALPVPWPGRTTKVCRPTSSTICWPSCRCSGCACSSNRAVPICGSWLAPGNRRPSASILPSPPASAQAMPNRCMDSELIKSASPELLLWLALLLFVWAIALLLLMRGALTLMQPLFGYVNAARLGLIAWLRHAGARERRLSRWILRLLDRDSAELVALIIVATLLGACIFAFAITLEPGLGRGEWAAIDHATFDMLQSLRSDELDGAMVLIPDLGGAWITVPIGVTVLLWLAWQRLWPAALYWLGLFVAARLVLAALKWM